MRSEKWFFWTCYLSALALLPYTLMNLLDPFWMMERGWLVLLAWIILSGFQWILFMLNVTYRRIVR